MIKAVVYLAALAIAAQVGRAFYIGDEDNHFSDEDNYIGDEDFSADGDTRMVGGETVTDESSYSYQVAIRPLRNQSGVAVSLPVCSGIIIAGQDGNGAANSWILTSATCAMSGTSFRIYAGRNRVQSTTPADYTEMSSSLTVVHPEYLQSFRSSDLALIPDAGGVIQSHVGGTNATIRRTVSAALLPSISDATKSYLFSSVNMAGWGYPSNGFGAASPILRKLTSRVVANFYCAAVHYGQPITNRHICTNGLINKGPCTGDSGAPLVISNNGGNRIIGLATLTPSSGCSRGRPGVFTRMGSYISWISDVTNYQVD